MNQWRRSCSEVVEQLKASGAMEEKQRWTRFRVAEQLLNRGTAHAKQ